MAIETSAKQWYIVHTYSGFEERCVRTSPSVSTPSHARNLARSKSPPRRCGDEGRKKAKCSASSSRYILVEMDMADDAWHLVKNTPKVTGFVGTGKKPTPLTQEEVDQILTQVVTTKEKPKPKHVYEHGEHVRIIDGPFSNFTGVVEEVNLDRNTLKVMVTIFGRSTPVELDFLQVSPFRSGGRAGAAARGQNDTKSNFGLDPAFIDYTMIKDHGYIKLQIPAARILRAAVGRRSASPAKHHV